MSNIECLVLTCDLFEGGEDVNIRLDRGCDCLVCVKVMRVNVMYFEMIIN